MNLFWDPINLIVVALAAGFLLPLVARVGKEVARALFYLVMVYQALLPLVWLGWLADGAPAAQVFTAGIAPPFSINLLLGMHEAFFVAAVNLIGLLGGWYLRERLLDSPTAMSLFVVLTMGVDGIVMTRDLFNLFIFIEISGIATYGLLALEDKGSALAAGFKYVVATTLASSFFLVGVLLMYQLTGTLNLDQMAGLTASISGPVGVAAMTLVATGLIIELKPYPANGWGLDVYETSHPGVAAMVSVGVSAGALFALFKVLPLITPFHALLAGVGGATFLVSNLMGLQQSHARRLLGYSSIGQMGLIVLALIALGSLNTAPQTIAFIVAGLFLNHLLAKSALFWLAGVVGRDKLSDWANLRDHPLVLLSFGFLLAALIGLPPFPGFWAKWELLMALAQGDMHIWIAVVLLGSLLEAVYLFRWFGHSLHGEEGAPVLREPVAADLLPIFACVIALFVSGHWAANHLGLTGGWAMLPVYVALGLALFDWLPGRLKATLVLIAACAYAWHIAPSLTGLHALFGLMLLGGGILLTIASFYRQDHRIGYYPLLAMLLLSMGALLDADTGLEFFLAWEFVTVASYLLVALGKESKPHTLVYLIFSLGSAYLILGGLALAYGDTGSNALADLSLVSGMSTWVLSLLVLGFVVKTGALGLHIWLPGAYSEAPDDFSAMLSAVVGKAAIFGLLLAALNLGLKGGANDWVMLALGWLGLLTALWGALMALFQEDMKRLLAYSSMGQVGYVVAAIATADHLGWVAAGYLAVNHLMFKGLLFLAIAGVALRAGSRLMYRTGGLIQNMPITFTAALVGIFAMSGVPPMTGFGGKWLLLNALIDKGWYWQAGLAFFASAVAFLYLFRLIHTIFLGQRKREHKDLKEAPWALLIPQLVLIGMIVAFSAYPLWLIQPLSELMANYLPQTLSWEGTVMKTHLGYWDGFLVINVVGALFLLPFLLLLFLSRFMRIQKVKQFNIVFAAERPESPETTHYAYGFYSFYERAMGGLVKPRATAFWTGVSEWSHTLGGTFRGLYTGNGQTYALYVVIYLAVLYLSIRGTI